MGEDDVTSRGRLRYFGHVQRKNKIDWVSTYRSFPVDVKFGEIREVRYGRMESRRT